MGENEDKSQESENASSADEKENRNKTALNVETMNSNDTKTSNDKVRDLLGQSKMTPEERERKRKELVEKQKKALQQAEEVRSRVSNEAGAETTQSTQPREYLVVPAVKFLSSPQIRNADEEKKIKFLLSKGLTRAEIDIAKDRVDKGQLPAPQDVNSQMDLAQSPTDPPPVPPPVPPRTYQMVVKRAPLWKSVILVLLITGAFSAAMIAVIKKLLGPAITAIISAKQQLYSHQLNLFRRFNESLSTILSLRKSSKPAVRNNIDDDDDDDESPTPYEVNTPPILLAPLATDLSELTEKLSNHQKSLTKYDTMPDLQLSLSSLASYLSSSFYSFSSWSSPNDRDSPASQVRSEIRSLKGLLINRRNFPKIPPVPAYSAQSQQSSSQLQQQQVNTSNED